MDSDDIFLSMQSAQNSVSTDIYSSTLFAKSLNFWRNCFHAFCVLQFITARISYYFVSQA